MTEKEAISISGSQWPSNEGDYRLLAYASPDYGDLTEEREQYEAESKVNIRTWAGQKNLHQM